MDISGWYTNKLVNTTNMFKGCGKLTSLYVAHFDVSNATVMEGMFSGCSGLTSLYLSGWNTKKVFNMSHMFDDCTSLESLDLSGWDEVYTFCNMTDMFRNCNSLKKIIMLRCSEKLIGEIRNALNDAGILNQVMITTE